VNRERRKDYHEEVNMNGGCFAELTRMIARGFIRLGEILASLFLRTVAFFVGAVLAPLGLGATREVVRRAMGWGSTSAPPAPSTRAGYAMLSGLLWTGGYLFLRTLWSLLTGSGWFLPVQAFPLALVVLEPILTSAVAFTIGAIAGVVIFGHDEQFFSGW
jgi:hypothetical protein